MRASTAITTMALGSFSIGVTWYVLSRYLEHHFGYGVIAPDMVPFVWPILLPSALGCFAWRRSGIRGLWIFPLILGAVALSMAGAVVGFMLLCEVGAACM